MSEALPPTDRTRLVAAPPPRPEEQPAFRLRKALNEYFANCWATLRASKSRLWQSANVVPLLCALLVAGGFVAIFEGVFRSKKKWRTLLQPTITFIGIFIAIASQWILAQRARLQENTFNLVREWHDPEMHKARSEVAALCEKKEKDSEVAALCEKKEKDSEVAALCEKEEKDSKVDKTKIDDQVKKLWILLHFFEKWAVFEYCGALDDDLAEKTLGNYAKWYYHNAFKVNEEGPDDNKKSLIERIRIDACFTDYLEHPSVKELVEELIGGHASLLKLVQQFTKIKKNRRDNIIDYFGKFPVDTTTTIDH